MTKFKLTLEDDFNFDLIGLCSHQGDYRVVWSLNDSLGLKLEKSIEPFMVSNKKGQVISTHSFYEWKDEEEHISYYFIQNKGIGNISLIPELFQIDYFLVIKESGLVDLDYFLNKVRENKNIIMASLFDPYNLKAANKLIF